LQKDRSKRSKVRLCISEFLESHAADSGNPWMQGSYFWNEGDLQSLLFSHLQHGGLEDWVHAEASVRWKKSERIGIIDLVVTNPRQYRDWYRRCHDQMKNSKHVICNEAEPFLAMIELKKVWRGILSDHIIKDNKEVWRWGGHKLDDDSKKLVAFVGEDLVRLTYCLERGITKDAHLILLDCRDDAGLRGGIEVGDFQYGRADDAGKNAKIDRLFGNLPPSFKKRRDLWRHLFVWHHPDLNDRVGYYQISEWQDSGVSCKFH